MPALARSASKDGELPVSVAEQEPVLPAASRSMSAATSALTGGRPVRFQVSPLSGNQAAVPGQEGAGGDQSVHPQPSQSPIT